jgi:hypothetical protein
MVNQYFFLLGIANNLSLILIFLIRKNHLVYIQSYGWVYLLLAAPAVYIILLVQREQKQLQYNIFLFIFLAFLALEALYDFILKIPFRYNWKLLTPYLLLYYAMNYGFVVMVWKNSLQNGLILLALFVVQITANIMTH